MKLWRVMLLGTVASMSAACMQDRAAPVVSHGNEVYKKDGRFDLQGNELPKYTADNPAEQDLHIADKYVTSTPEYGVAAELDEVKTTDITRLDSSLDTQAAIQASNASNFAPPPPADKVEVQDTPSAPPVGESFFDRVKRNVNDMADTIDKRLKEATSGTDNSRQATVASQEAALHQALVTQEQPVNNAAVTAPQLQVSTAAMQPPLVTPSSIHSQDTMPAPQPQLQPISAPPVVSIQDAPPPLNPRIAPEVHVSNTPATPAPVKDEQVKRTPINEATAAMAAMDKAMEVKTAHLQATEPAQKEVKMVQPIVEIKEQAKAAKAQAYSKAVPVDKIMMEEEVTGKDVPPVEMQEVGTKVEEAAQPTSKPSYKTVSNAQLTQAEAKQDVPVSEMPAEKAAEKVTEKSAEKTVEKPAVQAEAVASEPSEAMLWPVKGKIISKYNAPIGGRKNDGINIAAKDGDPFRAAGDGVVVYAGSRLKGYGNMVIIQHPNGYLSAYAHAKELMVNKGDTITRGQLIGTVGQSGGADMPQLHFALRKDKQPIDPQKLLADK